MVLYKLKTKGQSGIKSKAESLSSDKDSQGVRAPVSPAVARPSAAQWTAAECVTGPASPAQTEEAAVPRAKKGWRR